MHLASPHPRGSSAPAALVALSAGEALGMSWNAAQERRPGISSAPGSQSRLLPVAASRGPHIMHQTTARGRQHIWPLADRVVPLGSRLPSGPSQHLRRIRPWQGCLPTRAPGFLLRSPPGTVPFRPAAQVSHLHAGLALPWQDPPCSSCIAKGHLTPTPTQNLIYQASLRPSLCLEMNL